MKKILLSFFIFAISLTFAFDKYIVLENNHSSINEIKVGFGLREKINDFGIDGSLNYSLDIFRKIKSLDLKGIYYLENLYAGFGMEIFLKQYSAEYDYDRKVYYGFKPKLTFGHQFDTTFFEISYSNLTKTINNGTCFTPVFGFKIGLKL